MTTETQFSIQEFTEFLQSETIDTIDSDKWYAAINEGLEQEEIKQILDVLFKKLNLTKFTEEEILVIK